MKKHKRVESVCEFDFNRFIKVLKLKRNQWEKISPQIIFPEVDIVRLMHYWSMASLLEPNKFHDI